MRVDERTVHTITQNRPGSKIGDYCMLSDRENPYLKLQPLKVEVLLDDPQVLVFHDVVTTDEIDELKRKARSQVNKNSGCQK